MEIFDFIQAQLSYLKRRTVTDQDAEDIIQDVFEIVWNKRSFFNSKTIEVQKKIVFICIRHRFIDLCRHKKKARLSSFKPIAYRQPEALSIIELKEVMKMLEKYQNRQLIYWAEGYTTTEISEGSGIKFNTVLSNIHNARIYLKKQCA